MAKVYLKVYNQDECQIDEFDLDDCDIDEYYGKNYTQDVINALDKSTIVLFIGDKLHIAVEE